MKTALITGASSGIGEALAHRFAKQKHNVILVARRKDRLEAVAEALRNEYEIEATVKVCDLTNREDIQKMVASLDDEKIAVDYLVNNAGFGSNGPFLEQEHDRELRQIDLNVSALVSLSHHFATRMANNGGGKIMNVASTAGFQPGPYMAVYYATKAFVISFSEALSYELRGKGITVTAHCPGATDTEFAAEAGNDTSLLFKSGVATVDSVADHAYASMMRGDIVAIPGVKNKFGAFSVRFAPRATVRWLTAKLNRA